MRRIRRTLCRHAVSPGKKLLARVASRSLHLDEAEEVEAKAATA
jgi:hypothetical protein